MRKKRKANQVKPLNYQQQHECVSLLAELLSSGFTLQESLKFMKQLLVKERSALAYIEFKLSQGELLEHCFKGIGFSPTYVSQLYLADIHGDLIGTLGHIARQLRDRNKQKQQVAKALGYPSLLLIFLMAVILLMKWVLLPQLDKIQVSDAPPSISILFIEHGPALFLGLLFICLLFFVAIKLYYRKKSALKQVGFLMKLPLVNKIYRFYYTSFFACEWGKLINQGLEMRQLIRVMQQRETTELMKEVAVILDQELAKGQPIHRQIKRWSFFQKELSVIIQQGEAKGKLGDELIIYSERLWEQLNVKIERLLLWVQPLIFLLVALLIVGVYSALLLPIYKGMDELL